MSVSPPPLAYSIADVGKISSIGRTTIFALIRDGRLTAVKVGRRTLVLADSLHRLLASDIDA